MTTSTSTPKAPQNGVHPDSDGTATINIPYDQLWLKSVLHPFLIAVLVACLDTAWLALIARFVPALAGGYGQLVLLFSVAVAVLGCITTAYLAQPNQRQRRRPAYRWAEFAFVVLATRLILWGATGSWPTLTDLLYRPIDSVIDGLFLSAGLVVLFSWGAAIEFTGDLLRLALQPDELHALEIDRIGEMVRSSNSDRPTVLGRIVSRWVGGGILMVMAAAGLQVERPVNGFFALTQQNLDPAVIAAIVIYFLVGLVLVSQGQLALLRTRWLIDRVPSSAQVLRQWPVYVMLLLIAIGLLAMLLPFGGTFLLAQLLFGALNFIFNLFLNVFQFFMGLFLLLMSLIMGESPESPPQEAAPPPPAPLIEPLPPAAALLPDWAGGALFWITMTVILGYAAYIYLSDRGVQFTWLLAFWQMLRERWQMFFGAYRQWQQSRLPGRTQQNDSGAEENRVHWSKRKLDWRRLDPTQQARYFYLTTVEEAKERGISRTGGETPSQYAPRLTTYIADQRKASRQQRGETIGQAEESPEEIAEEQEVQQLTKAFIQARYSKRPLAKTESMDLVNIWQKIKDSLRLRF
jgi:Domain of unknown function (DUF4129)